MYSALSNPDDWIRHGSKVGNKTLIHAPRIYELLLNISQDSSFRNKVNIFQIKIDMFLLPVEALEPGIYREARRLL